MSKVPRKRPASSAPNSSRVKVRGRPANNGVHGTATSREAAERLSENTRPYQHGSVDQFVGQLVQVSGDGWSQAHEDAMDMMWQESGHSQAKLILLKLFKVCLRVFEISPIRFLSLSYGLEYQGERGSSAIFSKAFSNELTGLIVHPAFNGKKDALAIVIQYAVICRINNRRSWPNTASTPDCPGMEKVVEVLKTSESGKFEDSIHRTHPYARRDYPVVFHQQEAPTGEQLPEYYERAHKQKLRDWMAKSGFVPHQQEGDEPGGDLEVGGMDRDAGQDQPSDKR
ncbi:hypothetical protein FBULB1_7320 [Fusarium bulbicola]|nr:hypothetical protein FBULB1_7320 [Fusarium bulbicola]